MKSSIIILIFSKVLTNFAWAGGSNVGGGGDLVVQEFNKFANTTLSLTAKSEINYVKEVPITSTLLLLGELQENHQIISLDATFTIDGRPVDAINCRKYRTQVDGDRARKQFIEIIPSNPEGGISPVELEHRRVSHEEFCGSTEKIVLSAPKWNGKTSEMSKRQLAIHELLGILGARLLTFSDEKYSCSQAILEVYVELLSAAKREEKKSQIIKEMQAANPKRSAQLEEKYLLDRMDPKTRKTLDETTKHVNSAIAEIVIDFGDKGDEMIQSSNERMDLNQLKFEQRLDEIVSSAHENPDPLKETK